MEERKLIRLGNSSFAIALPKDWVDKSNLKKGDKVSIVPNSNGEIIISPEFKKGEDKQIEIHLSNKDSDFIKKNLHAAYTRGYNTLVFKDITKSNKNTVKELLEDYLSFEIIDANDTEIIVKDFFDMKEAKFENFVRRIDNNLKEMFEIISNELKNSKLKPSSLKEIEEIDKSVNKFYFLCSRIFMKGIDNPSILNILKMNGNTLFGNWWIAFNSESLGDGLKYVLKWVSKLNPHNKEHIYEIFSKLNESHILSMEAFYEKNSKKASEVVESTKQIRLEIEKLEKNNQKIFKIVEALELIRKNIYQNAKMMFYMEL